MPLAGFETAIAASERLQILAVNRSATGIVKVTIYTHTNLRYQVPLFFSNGYEAKSYKNITQAIIFYHTAQMLL